MDVMVEKFGGFAEDVQTPEDEREVLKKICKQSPLAWQHIIRSGKLSGRALSIAKEELNKLQ